MVKYNSKSDSIKEIYINRGFPIETIKVDTFQNHLYNFKHAKKDQLDLVTSTVKENISNRNVSVETIKNFLECSTFFAEDFLKCYEHLL